jgi:hypothetical protein
MNLYPLVKTSRPSTIEQPKAAEVVGITNHRGVPPPTDPPVYTSTTRPVTQPCPSSSLSNRIRINVEERETYDLDEQDDEPTAANIGNSPMDPSIQRTLNVDERRVPSKRAKK